MARLTISDLHKFYGWTHAVHGVDLDIPEGEFAVLVGPSGCGKSTLLRSIAGLEPVDGGTIAIDGEAVNEMRPLITLPVQRDSRLRRPVRLPAPPACGSALGRGRTPGLAARRPAPDECRALQRATDPERCPSRGAAATPQRLG
jgi:energy-coupling factor transporter ATP-binding protein EcfA2